MQHNVRSHPPAFPLSCTVETFTQFELDCNILIQRVQSVVSASPSTPTSLRPLYLSVRYGIARWDFSLTSSLSSLLQRSIIHLRELHREHSHRSIMSNLTIQSGCPAYDPTIDTQYGYVPSLAAGVTFVALFGTSLFLHIAQSTLFSMWWGYVSLLPDSIHRGFKGQHLIRFLL